MEWNWQTVKQLLLVVCGGVAFYCALQNLAAVFAALGWLLGVLWPFLLGGAIAFILNVPMRAIERGLFSGNRRMNKIRRPLALVLTLAAVIGVLTLASAVIGPGVGEAVVSLGQQIPAAFRRLQGQLAELETYLPLLESWAESLEIDWKDLTEKAVGLVQAWGSGLLSSGGGLIGGLVSGVSTFVIGFIFSLYILLQKEPLSRQGRQVLYMAKEELFRGKFLGGLLRLLGAFPVIRGSGGTDALENAYKLLDENGMVGIFIEGTRSKDGLLQRPKTGAALLAYRTKAPVVPVCITTGDGGLPKKFKRHIINIGKPIPAEALNIKDDSSLELRRASRTIMKEIVALREETLKELGLPSQVQAAGKRGTWCALQGCGLGR